MNRMISGILWDQLSNPGDFEETIFQFNLIAPRGTVNIEYIDLWMEWSLSGGGASRTFDNVGSIYIEGLISDFSSVYATNGAIYRRSFKDESRVFINQEFKCEANGVLKIYFIGSGLGFSNSPALGDTLDAMIGISGFTKD